MVEHFSGFRVVMLCVMAFLIPIAGFLVGAILVGKDDGRRQSIGISCLWFASLSSFILGIVFLGIFFARL